MSGISEGFKTLVAGIIGIGLVTAIGLNATGLAKVGTSAGTATQGVLSVAEKG